MARELANGSYKVVDDDDTETWNYCAILCAQIGEQYRRSWLHNIYVKYLTKGYSYGVRFFKLKAHINATIDPNRVIKTVIRLGKYGPLESFGIFFTL